MKRYSILFGIFCLFPGIVWAQNTDTGITKCPWDNAIDCIISNFKDKKNVSGSIWEGNHLEITIDKKNGNQIVFALQNTTQKQLKECRAESSAFFKVQATLNDIKENKSPNFSYMKCSDKQVQVDPVVPTNSQEPLKKTWLVAVDANTIDLSFDQNIQHDTVWVRIVDRSNYTMLPVKNYTKKDPKTVRIELDTPMLAKNEYNMTINMVLWENQSTIERGIDSIHAFTTPADLEWASNIEKKEPTPPAENPSVDTSSAQSPNEEEEKEYTKAYPEWVPVETTASWTEEKTTSWEIEEVVTEDPKTSVKTGTGATLIMIAVALWMAGLLSLRRKNI